MIYRYWTCAGDIDPATSMISTETQALMVLDTYRPVLRDILRRRRGRCDWRRQDWRSTGGLAPWHCATCGQTGYGSDGESPRAASGR